MSRSRLVIMISIFMIALSSVSTWAQNPEPREERREGRRRDRDGNRERPERNDRDGRPELPPSGVPGGPPPALFGPPPGTLPQAPPANATPADKTRGKKARDPRPSVTKKLPERYSSRDSNRDGQIGMYEWSRTDLATFISLDRNGDGFLEPSEFPDSTPTVAGATIPTPVAGPGSPAVAAGSPGTPPSAGPPPVSAAAKPVAPVTDPATRAAQLAYEFLDQDKDGTITPTELQRSRTVRPLFEKAQIDLQQTFTKEKFIETHMKVSQAPR